MVDMFSQIVFLEQYHNGYHTGIMYKGKVYDNLFKSGMESSKWIDVFIGLGSKAITYL